jgi:hypothetical protein
MSNSCLFSLCYVVQLPARVEKQNDGPSESKSRKAIDNTSAAVLVTFDDVTVSTHKISKDTSKNPL